MKRQLILVEGIPGVGKTTTAQNIKKYLDKKGVESKLFIEGNFDHPADYESVACLTEKEYNDLLDNYPINKELISNYIYTKNENYFIRYGEIKANRHYKNNNAFFKEVMAYDIYNLALEKYSSLIRAKWESFIKEAEDEECIYIFECCFLQNPLTTLMAHHNMREEYIKNHIQAVEKIIAPLKPIVVFLEPTDLKDNFDLIKEERSKEWLDFVIDYVTGQSYGKDHSLKGYVGLLAFYTHLKEISLKCLKELSFEKIILESSKKQWVSNKYLIEKFLHKHFEDNIGESNE